MGDSVAGLVAGLTRESQRMELPKIDNIRYTSPRQSKNEEKEEREQEIDDKHDTILKNISLFISSELWHWKESHKVSK